MFDEMTWEHEVGSNYDLTEEGFLTDQEAAPIAGLLDLSLPVDRQAVVDATSAAHAQSPGDNEMLRLLEVWAEYAESDLLKGEPLCDGSPFPMEP